MYHVPVNATAARVVSSVSPEETEREVLVRQAQDLHKAIKSMKASKAFSKEHVKKLGVELLEVNTKIKELKGFIKHKPKVTIEYYFIQTCRQHMHPLEFKRFLKMAVQERLKVEQGAS